MKSIKILLACAMPLFITACGSDSTDSTTSIPAVKTALEGTWTTDCSLFSSSNTSENSVILSVVFATDNWKRISAVYSDQSCKIKARKSVEEGRFSIENKNDQFQEIDYSLNSLTNTMLVDASVEFANNNNFFGYNEWKLNESHTVDLGGETFNIFKIEGDKLYTGNCTGSFTCMSKELRPDTIYKQAMYIRLK